MTSVSGEIFSFEQQSAAPPPAVSTPAPKPSSQDIDRALHAAEEAAYKWSINTDEIVWSDNAADILGCRIDQIRTGKMFANLLDIDNFTTRYEAVMNSNGRDEGNGSRYHIEYMFRSDGRNETKSIWIEDQGRWHGGPDGQPMVAYGTIRRIDERHRRDQHLNFLGNCDPLTGMMNRGRMTEALGEAITVATREKRHCAFAIAAVNNLPIVNEAYGFDVADEVIVALGRRLRQVMRAGDGIARYSGGKFGIILNECNEEELNIALERFLSAVRDSVIETQHGPVWAMLSIGAICLPAHAQDANTATAKAEEALNEARRLPSDGYVLFKPSDRRSTERALNARCATEIVQTLKEDRFKLAYQPIICATSGEVAMHEALLRMADAATGELITASHLVPISEHLGLVRLIDRSVMQMITKTLIAHPDANLTMNVSGTTAMDPRWYSQLLEILVANTGVAQRLTVEVTETVALSDVPSTRRFVEDLRELGCGVAIDDFGAGFTSFRNLRDLPVNMIKLDGSFCQDLRNNSENEYIVRSLIDLADKFKIQTVAEWIEKEEDADALRSWGIDFLQGNLIGEATISPPWKINESSVFSLQDNEPAKTNLEMPKMIQVLAPEAEIIVPELPVVEASLEVASIAEMESVAVVAQAPEQIDIILPEPDIAEPETVLIESADEEPNVELNFDEIDNSISTLRNTLDELRQHFGNSKTPEADRSAA